MKTKTTNDTQFLERLKKGNEDAYIYIVETYHHSLCTYANSLSRDIHMAEDIVQNVFVKLWERRNKLNSIFSIKGFLYRAVYNEFINQYQKTNKFSNVIKHYNDTLRIIVEEESISDVTNLIDLVKQEIQHLPPKCKEIFLLSKQEGLTNLEIAQYLKISVKAVERQMTRGFSNIRKRVNNKKHTILKPLQEVG